MGGWQILVLFFYRTLINCGSFSGGFASHLAPQMGIWSFLQVMSVNAPSFPGLGGGGLH